MQAALKLVKYLKQAPGQGILLSAASSFHLQVFCDADWAACPMTRRSVSGFCVMFGNSQQNIVARSSAEYRSMANALCAVKWIYNLLQELHFKIPSPISIFWDNTSAINIAENPVLHERTKHIELDCHLVRDHVNSSFIKPLYLPTALQPADLFTKPLSAKRISTLLGKLGVLNIFTPPNLRGGY